MSRALDLPRGARLAGIRFSSFGDVTLLGAALAALRAQRPDLEIRIWTKPAFAGALAPLPGVEVLPLPAPGLVGLSEVVRQLRAWRPDLVVDFHGTLRARILRALTPELRWRRAPRRALRRQLWVRLRVPDRAAPHVVERYAAPLGVTVEPGPWWPALPAVPGTPALVLAPGARWATKRWPAERWRALAETWRGRGGRVVWLGGREEADLLAACAHARDEQLIGAPLDEVRRQFGAATAVVANDSAPAHLASAAGVPVVALFGPTVPGFGFRPWGRHRVVEEVLGCRPCSLHGDEQCPLGHHRCMTAIGVDRVLAALDELLGAAQVPTARAVQA